MSLGKWRSGKSFYNNTDSYRYNTVIISESLNNAGHKTGSQWLWWEFGAGNAAIL